jgi:hypothetical protein
MGSRIYLIRLLLAEIFTGAQAAGAPRVATTVEEVFGFRGPRLP